MAALRPAIDNPPANDSPATDVGCDPTRFFADTWPVAYIIPSCARSFFRFSTLPDLYFTHHSGFLPGSGLKVPLFSKEDV